MVPTLVRLGFQLGILDQRFSSKNAQRTLGMFSFNRILEGSPVTVILIS